MDKRKICELLTAKFETQEFKDYFLDMCEHIPDYIFTMPSSTSGKYHNAKQCEQYGQLYHVFMFQSILEHLLRLKHNKELYPTPQERDAMRCVPMFHDAVKCGWEGSRWTVVEHPILASDWVLNTNVEHDIQYKYRNMIADMCESHSGEWNKNRSGQVIMSEPRNEREFLIHECDILASRPDLDWIVSDELKALVGENKGGGYKLKFGHYRGMSVEDVMEQDPKYFHWLINSDYARKEPLKNEIEFVQAELKRLGELAAEGDEELNNYIIPIGKYKGRKLIEIFREDPSYCQWMRGSIEREPLKSMVEKLYGVEPITGEFIF